MSRVARCGRLPKQGFTLILAGALLACSAPPSKRLVGRGVGSASPVIGGTVPAWLDRPPVGCAAGYSGPTLDPGDAIRQARRNAIDGLAADRLGVRIESELRIGTRGPLGEATTQEVHGILAESRIVAMDSRMVGVRASTGSAGPALREVYALACPADLQAGGVPVAHHPGWLLNIPADSKRICAVGVGGPTRDPDHQRKAALRDGRRALAATLESWVHRRILDRGRGRVRSSSSSRATERATALAHAVEALDDAWTDTRGTGPLATPGLIYGLACVDR